MKKLVIIILLLVPSVVLADKNITLESISQFIYESAVESDRETSRFFWWGTKQNPIAMPNTNTKVYEANPIVRNLSNDIEYDAAVDVGKYIILSSREILPRKAYNTLLYSVTILQAINMIETYFFNDWYTLPKVYMISYTFTF